MEIYKKQPPKLVGKQFFHYDENFNSWCWATQMSLIVEGIKAKPFNEFISETDLLTDSKKNIRARQRQKITYLKCGDWTNISDKNKKPKYNKAILHFVNIWSN